MVERVAKRFATSLAMFDGGDCIESRSGRGGSSNWSAGAGVLGLGVGVRGPRAIEMLFRRLTARTGSLTDMTWMGCFGLASAATTDWVDEIVSGVVERRSSERALLLPFTEVGVGMISGRVLVESVVDEAALSSMPSLMRIIPCRQLRILLPFMRRSLHRNPQSHLDSTASRSPGLATRTMSCSI